MSGFDVVQARVDGNRVRLTARDGRTVESTTVIAADGVHSVVARRLGLNPGWPAGSIALDMMEETPRTSCAISIPRRSGSRTATTLMPRCDARLQAGVRTTSPARRRAMVVARERREKATRTFFQSATMSTSASDTSCRTSAGRSELRRTIFSGDLSIACVPGRCRRRIGSGELHAVSDSDRRPAEAARPRPRAAGWRCRRLRQRVHGGGHLLRDGVGRSRGARGGLQFGQRARSGDPVSPGGRTRDRPGVERLGPDPAIPVQRPAADRGRDPKRLHRAGGHHPARSSSFAMGRRWYSSARRRILLRSPLLAARLVAERIRPSTQLLA